MFFLYGSGTYFTNSVLSSSFLNDFAVLDTSTYFSILNGYSIISLRYGTVGILSLKYGNLSYGEALGIYPSKTVAVFGFPSESNCGVLSGFNNGDDVLNLINLSTSVNFLQRDTKSMSSLIVSATFSYSSSIK
jgi:hypothetical protein